MIIPFTIKIPANTTHEKKITEILLPEGILTKLILYIPRWKLTAGIRFETEDGRKIPAESASERYFTGNDTHLIFDKSPMPIYNPMKLYAFGINKDKYDHVCVGFIEIATIDEIGLLQWLNGGDINGS